MTVTPGALGMLGTSRRTGATRVHRAPGHGTRRLLGHGTEDANHTRQSQSRDISATMLSYFSSDSHKVSSDGTAFSAVLREHTLLYRRPYAPSNTSQTPHGERLASTTPPVLPLYLANTFVEDTSSPFFNGVLPRTLRTVADTGTCTRSPTSPPSFTLCPFQQPGGSSAAHPPSPLPTPAPLWMAASLTSTQLLYNPLVVPLSVVNLTRCNAESEDVSADCMFIKSTVPLALVTDKSYLKASATPFVAASAAGARLTPDLTAHVKNSYLLGRGGWMRLHVCAGCAA